MLFLVVDDVDPVPKMFVLVGDGKKRVVDDAAKEARLFKLGKDANDHEDELVDDHVGDVVLFAFSETHFQRLSHVRLDVALQLIHLLWSRSVNGFVFNSNSFCFCFCICIQIQKHQPV